jgi:two-component system, NarL family, nitrate/nitrite response regulator NarL
MTTLGGRLNAGDSTCMGWKGDAVVESDLMTRRSSCGVELVVALRNRLARTGVESLLRGGDGASCSGSCGDIQTGIDVALRNRSILLVALQDIREADRLALRAAVDRGLEVLVLVDEEDSGELGRLAEVQVSGLLWGPVLSAELLRDSLAQVECGQITIPPELARPVLMGASRRDHGIAGGLAVRMTPREREVLGLLVEGLSNKQIARQLGISTHGAKRLVANILAKMDVPNRTIAVAKALRNGL